ncbi:MAG TPA: hypothetical protein VMV47_19395 [Bacteroidales bacterium]|nr:hypothetical protein [Bacteroidales bacterium]HUX97906.1 hypothetical protein [Bacteroidales bacterium]
MKNKLKTEKDWIPFNQAWGMQYKNAKHILSYLNTYPGVLNTLKLGEIHNPDNLDDAQNEWIWLCSKFENPIEIEFFRPYWISLEVDSYDYFMDISDENYPIFEIHFFFYEPYRWYKKFISKDIRELLLAPDTGLNLRTILDKNNRIRWEQVDEFFRERRRLGYEGKILVEPVSKSELLVDDTETARGKLEKRGSIIKMCEVTSMIAGLLPYELRIELKNIEYKYGRPEESTEKVKIIRDLVFLLRESGLRRVKRYRIEFLDSKRGFLEYEDESSVLHHSDKKILNAFKEGF